MATTFALGAESNRLPACLYVCLYVCHAPSNRFFFFVSRWNQTIFGLSVLRMALYKTLFFDFWFRPDNAKIYSPKFWHKIAYNTACTEDKTEIFAPTRGFSGVADSMEPYKMLWGRPLLLPWHRNYGKFGLFLHKIAYKSACMPHRPDMFGPTRGTEQGADRCCHGNDIWARHVV